MTLGCKEKGIRKPKFVAITQFLDREGVKYWWGRQRGY